MDQTDLRLIKDKSIVKVKSYKQVVKVCYGVE